MTSYRAPMVSLAHVDDDRLEQLVQAAAEDASPDEVTPPLTPGEVWTPERLKWLRAYHRERREGLAGSPGEATWAVVLDGVVAGAVRLQRTDDPRTLEAGIWLVRSARGRGVARAALGAVLDHARDHGAHAVVADTSRENASAVAVLERLGGSLHEHSGRIAARIDLART